jgi:hypothetical protein
MEITLLYLLDPTITMDGMLGKVPELRCTDHNMRNVTKFLELAEEMYLTNTGAIGPLDRPILEPM